MPAKPRKTKEAIETAREKPQAVGGGVGEPADADNGASGGENPSENIVNSSSISDGPLNDGSLNDGPISEGSLEELNSLTPIATGEVAPVPPPTPREQTSSARQLEDKMLVARARNGDQRAYFELSKRHRNGIERLIRPMVRNAPTDEVEDLVQEAMTKAFLHINSYSEEYAFSTWLYRIATNHAIDYLRRKKLNAFSISAPPTQSSGKGDDESREFEISDSSWVPEEVMLADERTALIEEAIENLPENYRRIIKLRHSDDLEYEEIARVLNIPMGTVKVHLHRARAALARALSGKI